MIRYGTQADFPAIKRIANQFSDELGFVRTNSLARGVDLHELFVAERDGRDVGFVNWQARRDGWNTVYELGVLRDFHGQGIGRALLYAVPCPIRLKVTEDNAQANRFYLSAGMRLTSVEKGRKRVLNVYEMNVLSIICRGASKKVPGVCLKSGSAYGVMEKDMPYAWPFMIDVDFADACWWRYARFVKRFRPVQALVVDYMAPELKCKMLAQVRRLRRFGVLRIIVCPKFDGAVIDIPHDCIVGVSLKTAGRLTKGDNKFAGFMPDFEELRFRRCHLLGGSPRLQIDTVIKLQGVGARVISCDGNAQFGAAGFSSVYRDGVWKRTRGVKVDYQTAILESSQNIQRDLNSIGSLEQLPLL